MKSKKIVSGLLAFTIVAGSIPYYISNMTDKNNISVSADSYYSDFVEQVAYLTNQERAKYGLEPLKVSKALNNVASERANELIQLFSHTRPNGNKWYTVLKENNIPFMSGAENIAAGQSTPEAVVASWMASTKGHRESILDEGNQYIGVGVSNSDGHYNWVQIFTGGRTLDDTHIPEPVTPVITTSTTTSAVNTTTTVTTTANKNLGGSLRFNINQKMKKDDVLNVDIYGDAGDTIQVYFNYADSEGNMHSSIIGGLGGTVLDEEGHKAVSFTVPEDLSYVTVKIVYNLSEPTYKYSIESYMSGLLSYEKYSDYVEITGCDESVEKIEIPSEIEGLPVKSIGENAFSGCTNLTEIIIPESVNHIGENAFKDTELIKSQDFIIYIGEWLIKCKRIIADADIKEGTRYIVDDAFSEALLHSLTLPESLISFDTNIITKDFYELTVLNPELQIIDSSNIIPVSVIYGYKNSTIEAYANKYGIEFKALDEEKTLFGDANNDGTIDVADVVAVASYVGNPEFNKLDSQGMINADVHNTGNGITADDALSIQQYLAKVITELPVK
ncbi:MAG: leucine-rich repeat protein [Oscillospiraceae bacterium]|nr:leucine-rich repeat protein [Oscillospiraceae bacterium]